MNRRDFLKACVATGIGMGLASAPFSALTRRGRIFGAEAAIALPEIIAVRGGEPDAMFDRGIAAMGGIGRFVKKGQSVAIKTNSSFDMPVDMAANTNPHLLKRVIQHCTEAGASRVVVFDHAIEHWRRCYDASGLAEAARETGALVAPAEMERHYHLHRINGTALTEPLVHEVVFDCDVLINLAILKNHAGGSMTAGIKNLMGAVWDRRFYHRNDLHQCIADFLLVRRPDLTVIDAYRVLTNNGPRSRNPEDVRTMKMQIISTDIVAADASGARLLGREPESVGHVRIAHSMGFGEIDPGKLPSRRISL